MRHIFPPLIICLLLTACKVSIIRVEEPAPGALTSSTETPTSTPGAEAAEMSATPETTPTITASATIAPTASPIPPTRRPPVLTATPTPAVPVATIQSFTVDVKDIASGGKEVTFAWETTGASSVRIVSGTAQRFAPWWDAPPDGTLTVKLSHTLYRDPLMTLHAIDPFGHWATQSIRIAWPCRHVYFFAPAPVICPRAAALSTWAAEQPFQNGRMIWLDRMPYNESVVENQIFVLYNDGSGQRFDDTWVESEPESDPAFVPPSGLYQPIRGFGKLWRTHASVRERIGWGLAPEQGFDGAMQMQWTESIGDVAYMRTRDDRIVKLFGLVYTNITSGSWEFLAP